MRFTPLFLVLVTLFAAGPATAASLCDRLFVPDGYTLDCRRVAERGKVAETATVTPTEGAGADLARLSLRELDRASDPQAWDAPQDWLRSQVTLDVGGLTAQLRQWSAGGTGPLASPTIRSAVDGLASTLENWGQAPLAACTAAAAEPGRQELDCSWGVAGFEATMDERLVSSGDRRFALSWRGTDEHTVRNLEAVANSFRPE